MRRQFAVTAILLAASLCSASAQSLELGVQPDGKQGSRHISKTGRMMPPPTSRDASGLRPGTEVEMQKAQRAAEERNKSWDTKTRRTMGTICNGC